MKEMNYLRDEGKTDSTAILLDWCCVIYLLVATWTQNWAKDQVQENEKLSGNRDEEGHAAHRSFKKHLWIATMGGSVSGAGYSKMNGARCGPQDTHVPQGGDKQRTKEV